MASLSDDKKNFRTLYKTEAYLMKDLFWITLYNLLNQIVFIHGAIFRIQSTSQGGEFSFYEH